MSEESDRDEVILEACKHYATFQCLVADHRLTGKEVARVMKLVNLNEQILEAGGERV